MVYEKLIILTAQKIGVPISLLMAICSHESGGLKNVMVPDDGGTPSYGICQVKEDTAKMFGYGGNGEGLMTPKTNVLYAAKYLKYQMDRYDNDWCKSAAAYNAGTYFPSKKNPGKPKNYGYVKKVRKYLEEELHEHLQCDEATDSLKKSENIDLKSSSEEKIKPKETL